MIVEKLWFWHILILSTYVIDPGVFKARYIVPSLQNQYGMPPNFAVLEFEPTGNWKLYIRNTTMQQSANYNGNFT